MPQIKYKLHALTKDALETQNMIGASYLLIMFNKTGLKPVSRPVVLILGVFPKGFKKRSFSNCLQTVLKREIYCYFTW